MILTYSVIPGVWFSTSVNAWADDAINAAYRPTPPPHANAPGARSESSRANGPLVPRGSRGTRSQRSGATAPRSRRSKVATPIASRTTTTMARSPTDGQSVTPAIGRCPDVHEYQEIGPIASRVGDSVEYDETRYIPNNVSRPTPTPRDRPRTGATAKAIEPEASIRSP
jgi:hypothetical protein